MEIKFKKLYPDVQIPPYATVGSAGCDLAVHNFKKLYSMTEPNSFKGEPTDIDLDVDAVTLTPHSRILIGCGFAIAIPDDYVMDIRSRSGNALKSGLVVLNSPGTIDSDYRGEIGAIISNTSPFDIVIHKGMKVAQGVVLKYEVAVFRVADELDATERGAGGFGHSDKYDSTKVIN